MSCVSTGPQSIDSGHMVRRRGEAFTNLVCAQVGQYPRQCFAPELRKSRTFRYGLFNQLTPSFVIMKKRAQIRRLYMRKMVSLVGVMLFSLSLCTAVVYGWPKGGGHGHQGGPGGHFGLLSPFMLKKLDLTDGQEQQIRQIRKDHRPAFEKLMGELHTLRTQIGDKFFTPGVAQKEDFASQFDQAAQLRQQLMQEGFAMTLEIRNILTPEQLAKANELRKKFQAQHEEKLSRHKDDQ